MFAVILADGTVQILGPSDRLVQAVEPAGDQLAPMAAEEFEVGVTVERTGKDQPQHVDARLRMPAESWCREKELDRCRPVTGVVRGGHRVRWDPRMDVYR